MAPAMQDEPDFDVIIEGGLWFDGAGSVPAVRHLGIRRDRVAAVSATPLTAGPSTRVIAAQGTWVMPGFVDIHTHYDAEVLVAPELSESVRHGTTTVFIGNCSLSTVFSTPLDAADLFSRVEALPRGAVLAALTTGKTWSNPAEYAEAIDALPLGANVAAFLGHSDVRSSVMGLGRSTDRAHKPSRAELGTMKQHLADALDAGFMGLSTMTNPWDKLDGDRYRSRSLPTTYAHWSEYRALNRQLRRRGRVLQSIPNINTKYDIALFLAGSVGLGRKALKTSLLAAADGKADPWLHRIFSPLARLTNGPGKGDFRWQHLPVPFQVYSDGIDLVVFEEFGAGRAALHLQDQLQRNELLNDEAYRRWFRADFDKKFSPRVWHRDFHDAEILECPDESIVGKTIADVADERGIHVVDAFLDLVVAHGKKLRWRTTVANHRPEKLDVMATQAGLQIGFSDSGAHLRNMAFYNFGVRFLKRVNDAQLAGRPFLSVEAAVHKLTGDLADWFGLEAGHLRVGDRADIAIIDPAALDARVDGYAEAEMPAFEGLRRMVNRNDDTVVATLVNGEIVWERGHLVETDGPGRFLRAGVARMAARERPTVTASA